MRSITTTHFPEIQKEILSCWQLGPQITGGRWYDIYHAAPKSVSSDSEFGYVLKRINPVLPPNKIALAIDRIGREAFATEQLIHPNVVRLLDAELDAAPFFLVQPWAKGISLDRYLANAEKLSLSRLLWTTRQIAAGVQAAHEIGRVHLGLEPAHVMLEKTGRVTLLGWSQSHAISEKTWLPHDQLQLARFTAPECFETDYVAETASDVYSLGVLIYQCLAPQAPFSGNSISTIARSHRHHLPPDLMFVQKNCPPVLSRLVKEMMTKNPASRPAFGEVLNRLIAIEIEHLNDQTVIRL